MNFISMLYHTKDMKRHDFIVIELWPILIYLCNEFKHYNTQQKRELVESGSHLKFKECEIVKLTEQLNEVTAGVHSFKKLSLELKGELESLQESYRESRVQSSKLKEKCKSLE